jgi:hypothetical protein
MKGHDDDPLTRHALGLQLARARYRPDLADTILQEVGGWVGGWVDG